MPADPEWLEDLFEPLGPIRLKRMFSGYGIYSGEFCIALAINPGLCLRVDDASRAQFEAIGAAPFRYTKKTGEVTVNAWWRLPDDIVDEPEELARLARLSLATARALPPKRKRNPDIAATARAKRAPAARRARGAT
jgi:DNA transformation protein